MLQGQPVDARQVAAIGEQLETLLRPIHNTDGARSYGHAARDALKKLIMSTLVQTEPAFDADREEMQAIAGAALPSSPAITAPEETNNKQTNTTYIDHAVIEPPNPLRSQSLTPGAVPENYLVRGQRDPWAADDPPAGLPPRLRDH